MPPRALQSAPFKYEAPPENFGDGNEWDAHINRVLSELLRTYRQDIEPIESKFEYDTLRPSWFGETIMQKKPFVTLLGPFSAGKSTFINYLMQNNYLLTGPQPTTDKFTVIVHGDTVQQVSGKVLVADQGQPFRGLAQFGEKFIECFGGVVAPHPILRSISVIDTPGVLENTDGDHKRRYDYVNVCRWFVERSDAVCVLFDPSKMDVGTELRKIFNEALHGHETKLRIILNKADSITAQELMRVYGGLFWSLSSLVKTTEPPRVYVSSFWDKPYRPDTNHLLFTEEKSDLLYDLTDAIPMQSLDNRVTSVISRCKAVYNHIIVVTYLKSKLPVFGKEKALKEMVNKLPDIYKELAHKNKCNPEDFPAPDVYRNFFERVDISKLPDGEKVERKGWIATLSRVMGQELPALLKPLKSAAVSDPRDRKHAIMLQREYNSGMKNQLEGKQGVQGALGEQATGAYRPAIPTAQNMLAEMQRQQQLQHQQQAASIPGFGAQQFTQQPQQLALPNMSFEQMQRLMSALQPQQPNRPYQPRF